MVDNKWDPQNESRQRDIRAFVLDTLRVSGASFREVDEYLVMAEVMVEIPPLFFDPPRLEKQTLNLIFSPEVASGYPGAELVTEGSFRLNWLIEGLKERGAFTVQSLLWEPDPETLKKKVQTGLWEKGAIKEAGQRYPEKAFSQLADPPRRFIHPHLLVNFVTSYRTDELEEELVSLGFDMVTGEVNDGWRPGLQEARMTPGAPAGKVEDPNFTLEQAWAQLFLSMEEKAQNRGPSWIEAPKKRYEEELFCLYQYYQEGREVSSDFLEQAKELYQKFRPEVELRPINVGFLYLPEVWFRTKTAKGIEAPIIRYRPFPEKVEVMTKPISRGEAMTPGVSEE